MDTGAEQSLLNQILAHLADAVYLIDPDSSQIVWCNRAAYEDLGYSQEEVLNHSVLSLQKDVQGLPQWSEIREVILANPVFTFVGRHNLKHGGDIAVEVNTTHFTYNQCTYFLSVARDITKRIAFEREMNARNQSIWFALNEASDGIWEWELASDYVFFSPQLKKMLGYGPDEMRPHVKTWLDNVHPDDLARVQQILQAHLQGKRSTYQAEYRLRNRNGHYLWVHDKGKVCQRNEQGAPTHVVGMVQNITDYKKLQQQLEKLAANDVLTGLPNRRHAYHIINQHIEQAHQQRRPLCLAVVDFDHFKQINDVYGHQQGDRVLQFGAGLIQTQLREGDFVFRWGGEEFVLLFVDATLNQAQSYTQALHLAFEHTDWAGMNLPSFTLSIGLTCVQHPSQTFEDVFKLADDAVYAAKRQGRNQTVILTRP
ncbi:MAG: diguanylate cyclase [Thiomicrospira sp.]|jgi:diguanylate cyclase (GGDEF)-like protein/PAS domain S-box-containing protein|nr:diguanylate cyclase [Thiomicrospira sp.]